MSIEILHPVKKTGPGFIAYGRHDEPEKLSCVLVQLTPKPVIIVGKPHRLVPKPKKAPPKHWAFVFHTVPVGTYTLFVADPDGATESVRIKVVPREEPHSINVSISSPSPGTPANHTRVSSGGFLAQGFAINGTSIAGGIIEKNGMGPWSMQGAVSLAPAAPNYPWALWFSGPLPTNHNPCRLQVGSTNGIDPPGQAQADNIDIS